MKQIKITTPLDTNVGIFYLPTLPNAIEILLNENTIDKMVKAVGLLEDLGAEMITFTVDTDYAFLEEADIGYKPFCKDDLDIEGCYLEVTRLGIALLSLPLNGSRQEGAWVYLQEREMWADLGRVSDIQKEMS